MIDTASTTLKKVSDLEVGDKVDLESCPFLNCHPMAEFEYAEVVAVHPESAGCICVYYEIGDPSACGYSPDTELRVLVEE